MAEVVKTGKTREKLYGSCNACDCIFIFQRNELCYDSDDDLWEITCPECDHDVRLDDNDLGYSEQKNLKRRVEND